MNRPHFKRPSRAGGATGFAALALHGLAAGLPVAAALPAVLSSVLPVVLSTDATARTCTELSRTCADSADRVVNGVVVHRECWRWEKTFSCVEEAPEKSRCDVENLPAACRIVEERCAASDDAAGCLELNRDLLCTEKPSGPGITAGDPRITVAYSTTRTPDLALGAGCSITKRTCLDAAPRRIPVENLPGETVEAAPACWKEALTVSCPSVSAAPSCAKLEAAGCTASSPKTCEATDAAGGCISWSAGYVCRGVTVGGDDVIEDGKTEIPDGKPVEDDSACREAVTQKTEAGWSCSALSKTCLRKNASGRCVEWEALWRCTAAGENQCAALEKLTASGVCREESQSVCELEDSTGACIRRRAVFRCGADAGTEGDLPAGDAERLPDLLETELALKDECAQLRVDPSCVETAKTCAEGPAIRLVNGEPVYKDCWAWSHQWTCQAGGGSECTAFERDPACRLVSESCPDGAASCLRPTRVYECVTEGSSSTAGTVCGGEACIAGVCTPTDEAPDQDFADSIVEMEIARQAGVYGDLSGNRFFSGEALGCRDRKAAASCCRSEPAVGTSNSAFSLLLDFGVGAGWEAVKYVGSPYVHDILSQSKNTAGTLNALYGGASSGVYEPSFSYWGATLSWSEAGGWSFNFSPAGFALTAAMHFYQGYASCRAEDQRVAMMKGERLCRYMGTVCTNTTPGLGCTELEERYVCFNSKLARILNEQGRAQLGRGWGTALSPDTRGFTAEELGALDFSKMDLSEFVADVVKEALKNPGADAAAVLARAQARVADMLEGKTALWEKVPGATGVSRPGGSTGAAPAAGFMAPPGWRIQEP